MFTKSGGFKFGTLLAMLWLAGLPASAATPPAVVSIARLGGDPNGYHALGALVLAPDGNYYGTTEAGGPPNCGTIFRLTPGGTFTTVYIFTGAEDGANPQTGLIVGPDQKLYGTTSLGTGANGDGTIFSFTTDGVFTTLHAFTGADGAGPEALTLSHDGKLYGTTAGGGASGSGAFYQIATDGTVSMLYSFAGSSPTDFYLPGAVIEGADHNFYGPAHGGANVLGVIFKITPQGVASVIYDFAASDGGSPSTALANDGMGNFYGATDGGVVYQITPAGLYTKEHTFDSATEGSPVSAALTLGSDGNFYGTTSNQGPSSMAEGMTIFGYGTVFRMTPAGAVTVLHTFNFTSGTSGEGTFDGMNPMAGVIRASDGTLYGTTAFGDSGSGELAFIGPGTVFQIAPDGTFSTLFRFTAGSAESNAPLFEASDGNFYGTSTRGGATNDGTGFGVTPDGFVATLHSFNDNVDGSHPVSGIIATGDGTLYGSVSSGGSTGGGAVYTLQLTPPAQMMVARPSASPADDTPRPLYEWADRLDLPTLDEQVEKFIEGLIAGDVGLPVKREPAPPAGGFAPQFTASALVYGVSMRGGAHDEGTVFSFAPDGTYSYVHSFAGPPSDGSEPVGTLVVGRDGNLYGTTSFGGAHNSGTVFSVTSAGVIKLLHSFAGTGDGAIPKAGLVLGTDGNFYGTTSAATNQNGGAGAGTLFRISAAGKLTTLHTFKPFTGNGNDGGANPQTALLQASDGNFYGVTFAGGMRNFGTVFSMTPAGAVTTLASFNTAALPGKRPAAPLIQASNKFLYGTTSAGGTDDCGTVFSVQLIPPLRTIAGAYSGLGTTATAGAVPKGKMSVTLSTAGKLSGSFVFGKTSLTLGGTLGADASFGETKKIAGHNVVVSLQGDLFHGTDALTGTISVDGVVYDVSLNRATFVAKTHPAPEAGRFTFTLPANSTDASATPPPPQGTAFATAVVSTAGAVTIAGKLADGTAFSSGGPLAKDGTFPLFARLYGNLGSLAGILSFTTPPRNPDPSVSDITGDLTWIKPAQPSNKIFPAAFTTTLSALGSAFTAPPKKTRLLPGTDANGDATLTLSLPSGGNSLIKPILITTANTVTYPSASGTDKLTLIFTTGNGLFSGHFLDTETNKSTLFNGIILEKQQSGMGYFVDPQGSGAVTLQAAH